MQRVEGRFVDEQPLTRAFRARLRPVALAPWIKRERRRLQRGREGRPGVR